MKRLAVGLIVLAIVLLPGCAARSTQTPARPSLPAAALPQAAVITLEPTPVPTSTFTPPLDPTPGSNYLRPADGMQMMDVPAGEFNMGSLSISDARPIHKVFLDEFWIDRTEVTNAMYAKCVFAGMCKPPILSSSSFRDSYYGNSEFANYPVIYVSWVDAGAYCAWAGGRLPGEAEWEKAARGTDERIYPWGDTPPSCEFANSQACKNDTLEVGSHPDGASPYGALDMAGNVWEFVKDWYGEVYYSQSPASNPPGPARGDGNYGVLRGGGWDASADFLRSAYRLDDGRENQYPNFGFRCAFSTP
jgi:eukaryotic-like serine/threonine-protein kinase